MAAAAHERPRQAPDRLRAAVPLRLLGDEQLTRLASAGDRRAFQAIYERHHQGLYRYCHSILRSPDDARDALQSTWVAVLRSLEGERREIALKPWLYRIAHNESISVLRRRRPQEEIAAAADVPAPEQRGGRDGLRQLVVDLRALPERQRAAIVMRELSDLSYEEIGATFGITPAAATQAVYDARKGLHELAEGRRLACDAVQRSISSDDRRVLRSRRLRAHLRACASCRDFEAALDRRRGELAILAPPMPAAAAAALLGDVLGAGAAGVVGAAGAGLGASMAAKGLAAVAALALGGGAALAVTDGGRPAPAPAAATSPARTAPDLAARGATPTIAPIRRAAPGAAPSAAPTAPRAAADVPAPAPAPAPATTPVGVPTALVQAVAPARAEPAQTSASPASRPSPAASSRPSRQPRPAPSGATSTGGETAQQPAAGPPSQQPQQSQPAAPAPPAAPQIAPASTAAPALPYGAP
ncbi:MAG: hypothetical protein QOG35_2454 [Solirubrobacteraceae bacterium]|jgi:RNA polymerase sigma factor (sigma-70 family)|nr:hypothetical protein [Solirubrobacteraceae bacterium]